MIQRFTVAYTGAHEGGWYAHVVELPAVHSYGFNLDECKRNIRAALALWLDCRVDELSDGNPGCHYTSHFLGGRQVDG